MSDDLTALTQEIAERYISGLHPSRQALRSAQKFVDDWVAPLIAEARREGAAEAFNLCASQTDIPAEAARWMRWKATHQRGLFPRAAAVSGEPATYSAPGLRTPGFGTPVTPA